MIRSRNVWMFVGLTAAAALSVPARAAEAEKLVPGDADAIISINVRQLVDSPVVKKHALELIKQGLKQNAETQKVLTAVGFDPLKDLTTLTVAAGGSPEKPKVLAIAHGNFDVPKMQAALEAHAKAHPDELTIHKAGDLTLYEGKDKKGDNSFAAFLDKETLVASLSKEMVLDAAAKKGGKLKPELQELIGKIDPKQSVSLAFVVNEDIKKALRDNPQTAEIADKLKAITGTVNVTDNVQAEFQIHTTDEKSAVKVRQMADGIKALLGLIASQNEEVGPLLNEVIETIKVSAQKTNVTVSVKVGADLIEKGAAKIKK